jgi:uncharacterized protein (DUF2461 family)
MVGGGLYGPSKEEIYRIRERIAGDPEGFNKLVGSKTFKETFGEMQGEKNKIIPKEFKEAAESAPLIFNKQWFYMADLPAETVLNDDLLKIVMDVDKKAKPIRDYLIAAVAD